MCFLRLLSVYICITHPLSGLPFYPLHPILNKYPVVKLGDCICLSSFANIYTPMAFACNEAIKKTGKYFPMNATGHMTGKLTLIFSKLYASRFTRFTRDPFPFISQCKQKSVLVITGKNIYCNRYCKANFVFF